MMMITDFKMPSLPGPELIRQALRVNPSLPIIAVSGRPDEYPLEGIRQSIETIVAKPFWKAEMMEAVDSTLAKAKLHCPSP